MDKWAFLQKAKRYEDKVLSRVRAQWWDMKSMSGIAVAESKRPQCSRNQSDELKSDCGSTEGQIRV